MRGASRLGVLCVSVCLPLAAYRAATVRADVTGYTADGTAAGWFSNQTDLLPTEVADPAFGKRYDVLVNGQVFAQPVLADDGTGKQVLVAATESNDVYGLNPDDQNAAAYWHVSLGQGWPVLNAFPSCADLTPTVGVTGTPVVDPATHTVYMTSKVPDPTDSSHKRAEWFMHALDLHTGAERAGFPVRVGGVAANQPAAVFDDTHQLQRPGLVLMGGVVYAAFGSHCDNTPYRGWIVGVNASSGQIATLWTDEADPNNTASTGGMAGIWMAGTEPSSDGPGTFLFSTGNGDISTNQGVPVNGQTQPLPLDLGESIVRVQVQGDGSLKSTDFFMPGNAVDLNNQDEDVGSGGVVVLPASYGTASHPHVLVYTSKDGRLTTLDRDKLGGWSGDPSLPGSDNVVSRTSINGGTWGRPGAWPGDGGWLYVDHQGGDATQPFSVGVTALQRNVDASGNPQFVVRGGSCPQTPCDSFSFSSGSPVITSNGTGTMTAVVWIVRTATSQPSTSSELMAYDPIPDSTGALTPFFRTTIGLPSKFTSVAVDHGHVYLGTKDAASSTSGHVLGFWSSQAPGLSESPLVFGAVAVNSGTTQHAVLTASRAVTISGALSTTDPTYAAGTPSVTSLVAGQTVDIPVTFTPTALGDVRAQLRIPLGDGTTVKVGLDGTGRGSTAHLSAPSSLDLGSVATNTASNTSVTLSNTGADPLTINSVSGPSGPQFAATSVPAPGTVINPGGSLAIPISFTSSTVGSFSDGIHVTSTANTVSTSLAAAATAMAVLTVSPNPPDIEASVPIGGSAIMSFSISNTGGTATKINKSKPPGGGDFTVLTPLPEGTPLAVGQTIPLQVRFSPSVLGRQVATWMINTDGIGGPVTVTLGGTGYATTGYWLVASDGGIFPFGNAGGYGSTGNIRLNQPIVGMAATASGAGYWLVASDGGLFPFGDAGGYGSTGAIQLKQPIVGLARTPSGRGYWLVASDGGIFPFGDAGGYGSLGNIRLNQPIVGMAPTRSGRGYWLVASDGGIFPLGDAVGYGSTGNIRLNQPIVGMARTASGNGYWLVAADGGIFPFGDAPGLGSTGGIRLNQPIVGMAATADGGGYWLVATDGGIFPFGDAPGLGSTGGTRLNQPIVGMAVVA